jgi:Mn2+/Fe2+ NRAMP family transporter
MQFWLANSLPSSTISAIQNWTKEIPVFIILITAITLNRHGIYAHRDFPLGRRALQPLARKFAAALFTVRIVDVGFLAIPTLAGSAAYVFAPRPGQEIEAGTRVLRSHSLFNRNCRHTGLRRH